MRIPFLLILLSPAAAFAATFEDVRPILEHNCIECHGPEKPKGDLSLHTKQGLLEGGENDAAVDFEKVAESALLVRVRLAPDDEDSMPPSSEKKHRDPLSADEIFLLENWIKAKAPWPDGVVLQAREKGPVLENPDAPDPELASITVYPASVSLETKRDYHRLVIIGTGKDAVTRDVTPSVQLQVADTSLLRVEGTTLFPLANGSTTVTINFRGQKAEVPVVVKEVEKDRPITFQQDVMPIITAAGCNTGSCHGSARGQDGFMLSIFGYDPKGDHYRLTKEMSGRRLNMGLPEESLFLTKAIGSVPHTGGKLFDKDHPFYATLLEWIETGAKLAPDDIPMPVKVEVEPKLYVLSGQGKKVPLTVKATYSDGSDRDVSTLSKYTTSNDNSAGIEPTTGVATSKNRGEAFLMARFHTFTEGAQAIVIPDDLVYKKPDLPEFNYIDKHIYAKLHKLRLVPSDLCSDEVFLRRVFIDVIGQLPTVEERANFLADANPKKREALVDNLLSRKEFTEIWVMKWAELLQIRSTGDNPDQVSYKAATLWYEWLRERIANNEPFNKIIYELLASKGGTFGNPATNYFKLEPDVKKMTENAAQVFMGTRIQCAQCHDHPFDRWTMDDYYGFASFFAQVKRKRAEDPSEQIIFDGGGEINNPLSNKAVPATFLGGATPDDKNHSRREQLATWISAPENPWFAKNVANIMWSHFFGIGIVDPVDDVRISNPATNPKLLETLGQKFVEYNFDMRKLVRDICTSRTYQLSTRTNESNRSDETNFSHSLIRRVRAEVLLDILAQSTETQNKFKGLPLGARAVQIADGNTSNFFLTTFGRSSRATVCSCEVKLEPNLSQALHLLNGENTQQRIQQGKLLQKWTAEKKEPIEIVKTLYLRCLGREPTPTEVDQLAKAIGEVKDPKEMQPLLEDIFWAVLNSKEFIFNH